MSVVVLNALRSLGDKCGRRAGTEQDKWIPWGPVRGDISHYNRKGAAGNVWNENGWSKQEGMCPPAHPGQPQNLHWGHCGAFSMIFWVYSVFGALQHIQGSLRTSTEAIMGHFPWFSGFTLELMPSLLQNLSFQGGSGDFLPLPTPSKASQGLPTGIFFSPLCPQLINPKCLCHLPSSSIKILVPGKRIQVKTEGGCGLLGDYQDREKKQIPWVL